MTVYPNKILAQLTDAQLEALERAATDRGLSRAEAIRQAIDAYTGDNQALTANNLADIISRLDDIKANMK